MYKDIINIIENYSHIDLTTYQYKCENCNVNCDGDNEITCCIYSTTETFNSTYSPECDFYKQVQKFKFQYICKNCYTEVYSKYDIIFFFKNILQIESFEYLFDEILDQEKEKILKKCQLPKTFVMQFNEPRHDTFKTIFTQYEFINNTIISHNLFYENTECLSKYFERLSATEKEHFNLFQVSSYLKLAS